MTDSYIEFDIEKELRKLPKKPGVYLMHGPKDEIIYIGKAVNLYNRVHQYFQDPSGKSATIRKMITLIRRFEYIVVDSELEALILENNLIKEHRPKYNTLLKDDKTYPYIKATVDEEFPRIFSTRKFRKDKSRYFGPYSNQTAVKECIDLLHKLFLIRTCQRKLPEECGKERPCLYAHLGQCMAPCTGDVKKEEYAASFKKALEFLDGKYEPVKKYLTGEMEKYSEAMDFEKAIVYRDLLRNVEALSDKQKITQYDTDDRDVIGIQKSAEDAAVCVFNIRNGKMVGRDKFHLEVAEDEEMKEIVSSFVNRFYTGTPFIPKEIWIQEEIDDQELIGEWLSKAAGKKCTIKVPKIGEKSRLVELACENASIILKEEADKLRMEELRTRGAMNEIRDLIGLPVLRRVESYDISNTSGVDSVGSMVVFYDGEPKNNDYRKFRIKTVSGPDDYSSLKEVLYRRFTHEEGDRSFDSYPDLILMDGGKGQVNACLEVIADLGIHIPVAGMVKDDHHRTRGLLYQNEELPLSMHSEGFKLVTRIQDETHRFAIEYHRSLRSKEQVHSVLDDIPNVGPKRRRALMRAFKDIETLRNAAVEEILEIPEMDRRSAESVAEYFHGFHFLHLSGKK